MSFMFFVVDYDSLFFYVGLFVIVVGVKMGFVGVVVDELGFVGEVGGEFVGYLDLIEVVVFGMFDRVVVVVVLLRGSEVLVVMDFVGEMYRLLVDVFGDGVVELVGFDGVLGVEEYDIVEEDFVFECGVEVVFWLG